MGTGIKDDFMRQDILELRESKQTTVLCESISYELFIERLEKNLTVDIEKLKWKEYLNSTDGELENEMKEALEFKSIMFKIVEEITNISNYIPDLWADIYLGLLRADKECDIYPNDSMEQGWESEACNSKVVSIDNAKKHYPLADYGDKNFPMNGIIGGCKDYHELMMQQKNIGFFDIDSKKDSLRQYAFPKTHEIYQTLVDSPIENLLLLEKTQGIGYTNQLFHYMKDITRKEELEKVRELIRLSVKIPMFIRKNIVDIIWSYLYKFHYNEISIQYILDVIYSIIHTIDKIYQKIWKFSWKTVRSGEFPECALKGTLALWWREYFNEAEVYEYFVDSKGLYGWKDIEKYDECFIKCEGNGKVLLSRGRKGNALANMVINSAENDSKLGEKRLEEAFKILKKQEQKVWDDVDPKEKTIKLKPMDVYAMVHVDIVKELN